MTLKRAIFILVLVLIAGAYIAGYWPEHRSRAEAEARLLALETQLDSAEAQVRLGLILGQLLRLSDTVRNRNYGEAAEIASGYFDRVRDEVPRAVQPDAKQTLDRIVRSRDQITAALARTDPSVEVTLQEQSLDLRRTLGYPVPSPSAAPPQ